MIDRASPNDLMQLAFDIGPLPMQIAAVVLLEPGEGFDLDGAVLLVGERLGRVPRLRQWLVSAPIGCGRPYWTDDPTFDPRRHVLLRASAAPGDEVALLDTALAVAGQRLPRSRPLWSVTFVDGLADGRVALVVVLHHVVADGLGGLAVLGALVDEATAPADPLGLPGFPVLAPTRRALFADAWASRLQRVARVPREFPGALHRLGAGLAELGASRHGSAPRTSLNRPTGARRAARVVRVDLAAVVTTAHAQDGTVNDVVLAAVTRAVGGLLAARGEMVPRLVVSVPVSARSTDGEADLSNHVGVILMDLPASGEAVAHLASVVAITRTRKHSTPGASAALVSPAFRLLGALGVLGWVTRRQRFANTFVTNVRGPAVPLTFMGATVTDVIPISGVSGNAAAAFTVLSYAGVLAITVVVDPDLVPDLAELTAALRAELDALIASGAR